MEHTVEQKLTLGQWMRQRRGTMKSADCAKRAGMKPQAWSDWENDRTRRKDGTPVEPRRNTIERIAKGLNVPIEEVLFAPGLSPLPSFGSFRAQPERNVGIQTCSVKSDQEFQVDCERVGKETFQVRVKRIPPITEST